MKKRIQLDNQEHELDITKRGNSVSVAVGDGAAQTLELVSQDGPWLVLRHLGKTWRVAGVKRGDQRHIWVNGKQLSYQLVTDENVGDSADTGSLSASIPAVVSDIVVAVGDSVTAGDKLILLESMKMIIPIQAPSDGVVTSIDCAVGDSVQPGVALISLE